MSLKVVLLTRFSRPSGAQMAWRLCRAGMTPAAVIAERRGKMTRPRGRSGWRRLLSLGPSFLLERFFEALHIRLHFWLRRLLGRNFHDPVYLSIEEVALDYPIRIYPVEDHNGREAAELLRRLVPDLGVLTNTRRIEPGILSIPRLGFLNLHLSALPRYAGLDSIFWALYHGEREIGATVHFVAPELDRGHIVIQKKIAVGPFDDEKSLYAKALWLGTSLMVRAIRRIEEGIAESLAQDPSAMSYFSWPTERERRLLRSRLKRERELSHNPAGETRVLHVITRMSRGGAQENTLASVRGLRSRGYRAVLVTGPSWDAEGEILSEALERGLEVVLVPELVREIRPWKDAVAFWKLWRLLGGFPCQVVHTHMSKAGWLGRYAASLRRVPVIVHTPHGHVFHSYFSKWKEKLFLQLERWAAGRCQALVALTERCRLEHLERGVGKDAQWLVIASGIDPKRFVRSHAEESLRLRRELAIPEGRSIVGYVGRLEAVKGPLYLIEAVVEIRRAFGDAHFLFVGEGKERSSLEARTNALGESDCVTFAGDREGISKYLSLMDVLVVPSLNEGMGRVVAEAGLLERPVVASAVGGIPDLVLHEKTGLLVSPRSPSQIALAVLRLLKEPDFAHAMGSRLRERVLGEFTEEEMVSRIDRLYKKLGNEIGIRLPSGRAAYRVVRERTTVLR